MQTIQRNINRAINRNDVSMQKNNFQKLFDNQHRQNLMKILVYLRLQVLTKKLST